jgi:hypothetical protein
MEQVKDNMQLKLHYKPRPKVSGATPLVRIAYDKWLKNVDEKCEAKQKSKMYWLIIE